MNTQIQNGTSHTPDLSATTNQTKVCPCEKLKIGQAMIVSGRAQVAQGEDLMRQAKMELAGLMEVDSPITLIPVLSEVGKENANSFEVIDLPKHVIRRGTEIPLETCKSRIQAYMTKATREGDSWISFQKISAGTGLSSQPLKRGLDVLMKGKKVRKIEKSGNPIYKDNIRNINKKMTYFELK